MRIAPLALAALLLLAPAAPAADDADVVVTKWLVLPAVDQVARRTLRADAVFAKHLLDRASPPPKAGDEITGTLGKPAKWTAREAVDGEIDGEGAAWSYASVESPADRVVIAKLEGAGVVYVNGAGFPGDVYRLGDAGFPVALRKGVNDVYVAGPRGGFRLTFREAKPAFHSSETSVAAWANKAMRDRNRDVQPDQVEGQPDALLRSWRLLNISTTALTPRDPSEPSFVPLGVRNLVDDKPVVLLEMNGEEQKPIETPRVKAGRPYRRTFISKIDGSVQSYAVVPPAPSDFDKPKIGLVLSLHGAGVECMDQARAYASKPDFWIVCPTNRGRYGFDWQDWGRLDAYEVLEDALKVTGVDPRRVYLTGHSMGGHGTWHVAANDPGRFLAIAPSAGWSSFESYSAPKMTTPLASLWRAADGASQTLELVQNLAQVPAYVLHGEKDDNVPASEARLMIDAVTKAGGKVESHFEPDAGHWWDKDEKRPGADCVDWPGIWELFRRTQPRAPSGEAPREIDFAISPGDSTTSRKACVESGAFWIYVCQPIEFGRQSRVRATWDGASHTRIETQNVRELSIMLPPAWPGLGSLPPLSSHQLTIDGQSLQLDGWGEGFIRERDGWRKDAKAGRPSSREAGLKHAFKARFVLVYGTAGDDAEDKELLEKARYDSEVWAYRANGDANLMSDEQFLAGDFKDRNVIVYGNADTNRAWGAVFDDDCPIQAKRGVMTVNGAKHEGVVAAAFVRPRKGSTTALAAAFADTGAAATRMFYAFPVFSSGVGIPDYVVFGPGFLREWDGDVRAAGWFDHAWRMR